MAPDQSLHLGFSVRVNSRCGSKRPLHIWPMSTTETALTAHLVRPGVGLDDAFLTEACEALSKKFGISQATLQIEAGDGVCKLAPEHVV
jgi:cobalt-zinc-cadmium efflux system protein